MSETVQTPSAAAGLPDSLRVARENAGVSLADLSQKTRISVKQLEALEAGRYAELPGIAFVKGAIRSCAKVLNFDAQLLLAQIQAETTEPLSSSGKNGLAMPLPADRGGLSSGGSRFWFWGTAVLALVALGFFFANPQQWRAAISQVTPSAGTATSASSVTPVSPIDEKKPPVEAPTAALIQPPVTPGAVVVAPQPSEASPTGPSLQTPSATTPTEALNPGPKLADPLAVGLSANSAIEMQFARDSWVEVRQADGKIINNQLHKAGTKAAIAAQGPVALIIGGASGVSVNWQGQAQDLKPFTRDDVARLTLK